MRLFLIRHGETVDNVAQVYAGVKDSALTVHGKLQAERLGQYYADKRVRFTHIFSSDLQRAYKTANAILAAQRNIEDGEVRKDLEVMPLVVLQEQDFGFYEGKPFYARSQDSSKSGKDNHRDKHRDEPDFQDVESKEAMALRMNEFLQEHLIPILQHGGGKEEPTIAIVSHGIILSQLWKCFLKLFPRNSVAISPGLSVGRGDGTPLEHLGGWSNTGYLDLEVKKDALVPHSSTVYPANTTLPSASDVEKSEVDEYAGIRNSELSIAGVERLPSPSSSRHEGNMPPILSSFGMVVKTVNGKEHLANLKRTRGVGSSEFDEGQKSIDTFFKKQKV